MSRPKSKLKNPATQNVEKKSREVRRQLKEIASDLWQNELIVKAGLVASGIQLAIAFSYSSYSSYPGAILKATFIEACVWNLNKAIAWSRLIKLNWRWQTFLWAVLVVVMFISTRANLYYEYEKKLQLITGRETVLVNSQTVDRYLGADEVLDAWQRGGLIPLLVLAMIAARRVISSASGGFAKEETQKTARQLRDARYRAKKKAEKEKLLRKLT